MISAIRNSADIFRAHLAAHAQRIVRDQRGVSLIEFAMLLPLMLTLFVGTIEISQAVAIDRKVSIASRSVADLVAQVTSVSDTDMDNIKGAGKAVLYPFYSPSTAKLGMVISSVKIDASKVARIDWSDLLACASCKGVTGAAMVARTRNDVVTSLLPAGILIANTTVIWAEVSYTYSPIIAGTDKDWFWKLTGDKSLTDQIFMRPRLSDCVQRPPNVTSCSFS